MFLLSRFTRKLFEDSIRLKTTVESSVITKVFLTNLVDKKKNSYLKVCI